VFLFCVSSFQLCPRFLKLSNERLTRRASLTHLAKDAVPALIEKLSETNAA
jgi:hypothetical protein